MSKPVTELYEAAEEAVGVLEHHTIPDLTREKTCEALLVRIGHLDMVAAGSVGTSNLLEVLDLVATSESLGLVRWVVGLSDGDVARLRWALADGACNAVARALPEESQRLQTMLASLYAVLPGGKGGAKEEAAEPKPTEEEIGELETRLSKVRAKIRSYDGGDRPSSPPMALFREELDVERQLGALKRALASDEKPTPRVLPAGKPPPFLRVGMVLLGASGKKWWVTASVHDYETVAIEDAKGFRCVVPGRVPLEWPLAEDFSVEGEA